MAELQALCIQSEGRGRVYLLANTKYSVRLLLADDTAWARGAAAAALKELYGAPWSKTGPARPRNSTTETGREAE
jgi:hypothetical protein